MSKMRSVDWDRGAFGEWLRTSRARWLPRISQDRVAFDVGVSQKMISRWEGEELGTQPPTLPQSTKLANYFDYDVRDVARIAGQWDDEIEQLFIDSLERAGLVARTVGQRSTKPDSLSNVIPFRKRNQRVERPIESSGPTLHLVPAG